MRYANFKKLICILACMLIIVCISGCDFKTVNGAGKDADSIPLTLTEVPLPQESAKLIPGLELPEHIKNISFSDEFAMQRALAVGDGKILVSGNYAREYTSGDRILKQTNLAQGDRRIYFVWFDGGAATKQMRLPENYTFIEKFLYDANSNRIFMLCIRRPNMEAKYYEYTLACIDSEGAILWEKVCENMVADMALIPSQEGSEIVLITTNYQHTGIIRAADIDTAYASFEEMKPLVDENNVPCPSALQFMDLDGDIREIIYEHEYFLLSIDGNENQLVAGCAWYENVDMRDGLNYKLMQGDTYFSGVISIGRQSGERWVFIPEERTSYFEYCVFLNEITVLCEGNRGEPSSILTVIDNSGGELYKQNVKSPHIGYDQYTGMAYMAVHGNERTESVYTIREQGIQPYINYQVGAFFPMHYVFVNDPIKPSYLVTWVHLDGAKETINIAQWHLDNGVEESAS